MFYRNPLQFGSDPFAMPAPDGYCCIIPPRDKARRTIQEAER